MKSDIKRLVDILDEDRNIAPKPDIAICSTCGWRGSVSECERSEGGDWEFGYYAVYLCPVCEDGGCIEDYGISSERWKEFEDWKRSKGELAK